MFKSFFILILIHRIVSAAVTDVVVVDTAVVVSSIDTSALYLLDKMHVSLDREQKLIETAHSLIVISSDEWSGTGKSVADVLQLQSGIQTRRYGGTGYMQTVSMRGVPGSRIIVCIDGVEINSAMGGAVDLSKINMERIESIEIHKGITPASLGGNGMGGVINFKTKRPSAAANRANVRFAGGSYGRYEGSVSAYRDIDSVASIGTFISYHYAKNSFPYLDRNNTITTTKDDIIRRVVNGQYSNINAAFTTDFWLKNGSLFASRFEYAKIDAGIPAEERKENVTAGYSLNNFVCDMRIVSGNMRFRKIIIEPRLNIDIKSGETHWTGLDHFGHPHGMLLPDEYAEIGFVDLHGMVGIQISANPFSWLSTDLNINATGEDFDPKTKIGGVLHGEWPGRRACGKASFVADLRTNKSGIGATFEGTLDGVYTSSDGGTDTYYNYVVLQHDSLEFHPSGRLGIRWASLSNMLFFANGARYYRVPSLRELFGAQGAVLPNPELKTESGFNFDYGIKWKNGVVFAELLGFYNRLSNGIYIHNDGKYSKATNLGSALTYGAEINFSCIFLQFFEVENHLTLQRTENLSDVSYYYGKELPGEPHISNSFMATLGQFHGFDLRYTVDFKSPFFRDFANIQNIPNDSDMIGLFSHSMRVRWQAKKSFSLSLSVNNIGGKGFIWEDLPGNYENSQIRTIYPGREYFMLINYDF